MSERPARASRLRPRATCTSAARGRRWRRGSCARRAGGRVRPAHRGPRPSCASCRAPSARIEEDLRWLGPRLGRAPMRCRASGRGSTSRRSRRSLRGASSTRATARAPRSRRVASAPHAGEETVYPGLCRDRDPARADEAPARAPRARSRRRSWPSTTPWRARSRRISRATSATSSCAAATASSPTSSPSWSTTWRWASPTSFAAPTLLSSTPRQICAGANARRRAARATRTCRSSWRRTVRASRSGRPASPSARCASGDARAAIVGALAHGLGLAATNAPATALAIARAAVGMDAIAWRRTPWPFAL